MIRILGPIEICHVTGHAIGRCALISAVRVAGGARKLGMCTGQREMSEAGVVKFGAKPPFHAVAGVTRRGQAGGFVIRILRAHEGVQVARLALCGKADELPAGRAFVTGIAVHSSVRPKQREAVLMLMNRVERNVPALHRVALLALRSKLPAMYVGVAVGTFVANVGENQADVTLAAFHFFVHAAQRIFCPVVIKLRNIADGLPTGEAVAVLAGLLQVAVRAARHRA